MYLQENNDFFMPTKGVGTTPGAIFGNMDWAGSPDNIDAAALSDPNKSLMANYVKSSGVYKCPGDKLSASNGERVRSISMNGALGGGSGPTVKGNNPNPPGPIYFGSGGVGRAAKKINDVNKPGPVNVVMFLDEHPDSINDAQFMFDPGYARSSEMWRDLPGSNHSRSGDFSYCDGHSEAHKWAGDAIYPVLKKNYTTSSAAPWGANSMRNSRDYEWLESRMPYQ